MRYMLLIYRDEKTWNKVPQPERVAAYQEAVAYTEGLREGGVFLAGEPLEPVRTATTMRMKNGKTLTTDGPFAETKEQLGGYSIVEARNLDDALSVVASHPLLRAGFSIEVRAIREGPPRS
jgi:hypothetical protein